MILLLALSALADPVAQRSPVEGDVVAVAGAPHQAVAWRVENEDEDRPQFVVSAAVRLPSAATDVSVGLRTRGGERERGWAWAAGASVGVIALRDPAVGLSVAPWARVERRGPVHGGAQIAAPVAARVTGGTRLPILGELFIGSQRERVHVLAMGGAGWAFAPGTPAGALVVQGTVHLGVSLR